jgi:hypothetical protein
MLNSNFSQGAAAFRAAARQPSSARRAAPRRAASATAKGREAKDGAAKQVRRWGENADFDQQKLVFLCGKTQFVLGKPSFFHVFPETGLLVLEGECTEFPVFCWVLTIAKDGD